MQRFVLCLLILLLTAAPVWAARNPIPPINKSPYVSALVVDADTGNVLFEDNADARVYPASVLKLMVLYVLLDRLDQGLLKLDEMVPVTVEAYKTGGSQVYLDPKEQFTVEELLYALMVQSANDAAVALASHVAGSKEGFVALMNQKAEALGMKSTRFHSVHGLPPSEGQEPDVTTARDLAILCRELAKRPDTFKYTGTKSRGFRNDTFMMYNHNKLLTQVPGSDGFKTGYYQAAGFSIAATAKRGGVRIISLVMGSADRKERDAKAMELLGKGFSQVPPRPETITAATPATPAASPPATAPAATPPAAGPTFATDTQPTPAAQAEGEDASAPDAAPAPTTAKGSGWGSFFIGLGVGFALFLAFFVAAGILMKKRSKSSGRFNRSA
ncbi:D-alanyl-D-alanine carboxypeptidase family protein [Thiohalocapsa marina]|jgi:D-alanyl-D-alanine carboxypeptidase (penicillin-binding protein 5/6)|uniref:D-alanyl-D-alanine carboxypeptidase family protein n=1 Tax=Thiohalocapsa marina TaxID=424902 RepID=UPI0036DD7023